MNIILLSGGSGKRLWPLSNEVRSKQFLKILKRNDGSYESMIQRIYRKIREVDPEANITIATSESQAVSVYDQLKDKVGISIEPCRRDTFAAMALATAYLHDFRHVDVNDAVVVCPVDHFVENDYFEKFLEIYQLALEEYSSIVLMGIEPTCPSEKYGYIIPKSDDSISAVESFKEKPDTSTAKEYIKRGALWNAGVFAYKLDYVLKQSRHLLGMDTHKELVANYENLRKISFDYAVVEKETDISVVRFSGEWKDIGSWDTLTDVMTQSVIGNAISADCENTHVINELQIPLVAIGVNNLAIAATPDGILVTDKYKGDAVKDYVSDSRPMHEKRGWGEYVVLDYYVQEDGNNSLTKHLIISSGKYISYQKHFQRTEVWSVINGTGKLILDGKIMSVGRGSTVIIMPGMKHAIKADSELHIIEVQIGTELSETDIERLDWNWDQDYSQDGGVI